MTARRIRGRAFVRGRMEEDVVITITGQKISDIRSAAAGGKTAEFLRDSLIVPGFIDVHVHGAAGADFMDAIPEAARTITRYHALHGTAALAATTLSGSREAIRRAIDNATTACEKMRSDEAEIGGIHLEGPYIHPDKRGAHHAESIRRADVHETESWLAAARHLPMIMTVAPEVEGVRALIDRFHKQITFSIGHTTAGYRESLEAVQRGASHFTHLFNAMTPLHQREPGVVGAALSSEEATTELIADGIHVHPVLLRSMARLMPNRIALVTDAMRACGMPDGAYKLYEHDVTVSDGAAKLANGTLAGSVLTMLKAVQNMVELAGVAIDHIIPLASEVPARILSLSGRKGRIEIGYDADLIVLSPRLEINTLILRGAEIDRG